MRKRRAALYDDEGLILEILTDFFEMRGYEVLAHREPGNCPLYEGTAARCGNLAPCADLLIADFDMPRMTGLEMIRLQEQRGCRLTARNKAVISGHIENDAIMEVRALGCAFFPKPFRLGQLSAWVDACEGRMDLSLPLGLPRREERTVCRTVISYHEDARGDLRRAEVVNLSPSGLCIRSDRAHAIRQLVTLHAAPPTIAPGKAVVRWTRPAGPGSYLVGLSCC